MRVALLLAAVALTTGCSSNWQTFRAHGISVRYPRDWHATSARLTPVTSPVQVLAVASYSLPHDDRGAEGCAPKVALDRLPPGGAFIFGWEYLSASNAGRLPPRPKHFKLDDFAGFECTGPSYVVHFREAGRYFQIHVALGRDAGDDTRSTVLRILDSLEVKAGTRGR